MNKFQILNELQRCMERSNAGKIHDIWFHGIYMGRIVKLEGVYSCFHSNEHSPALAHEACFNNFSAAIGSFVEYAVQEAIWENNERLKTCETTIKKIGISKPSILTRIKWWFQ